MLSPQIELSRSIATRALTELPPLLWALLDAWPVASGSPSSPYGYTVSLARGTERAGLILPHSERVGVERLEISSGLETSSPKRSVSMRGKVTRGCLPGDPSPAGDESPDPGRLAGVLRPVLSNPPSSSSSSSSST